MRVAQTATIRKMGAGRRQIRTGGPKNGPDDHKSAQQPAALGGGPKSGHQDKKSARRRGPSPHSEAPDRAIARLAQQQHGVISIEQLRQAGLSQTMVYKRSRSGRLHPVFQGVYAVGHPGLSQEGRWMAAVMACGPAAVLSHRSAAALWRLLPAGPSSVDVTAPGRRGRITPGIAAHRRAALLRRDVTAVKGIPCTSVARTLFDLAGLVGADELRRAIEESQVLRLFKLPVIEELIDRNRGHGGVARLRLGIEDLDPQIVHTRSSLERRFLTLCRRAKLPTPEVNVLLRLGGHTFEADFVWRDASLIVETDGRQFHDTASAFERDRVRDQRLILAGWRVLRCTWRQVVQEPNDLARTLRTVLDQQG